MRNNYCRLSENEISYLKRCGKVDIIKSIKGWMFITILSVVLIGLISRGFIIGMFIIGQVS